MNINTTTTLAENTTEASSVVTRYSWTGKKYHYRMYHAQLGKFLSRDPIGYAGGDVNLYRYVGNRPTISVDPRGLWRGPDERSNSGPDRVWSAQGGEVPPFYPNTGHTAPHLPNGGLPPLYPPGSDVGRPPIPPRDSRWPRDDSVPRRLPPVDPVIGSPWPETEWLNDSTRIRVEVVELPPPPESEESECVPRCNPFAAPTPWASPVPETHTNDPMKALSQMGSIAEKAFRAYIKDPLDEETIPRPDLFGSASPPKEFKWDVKPSWNGFDADISGSFRLGPDGITVYYEVGGGPSVDWLPENLGQLPGQIYNGDSFDPVFGPFDMGVEIEGGIQW